MKIAKVYLLLIAFLSVFSGQSQAERKTCQRIVSLAPSITEMLFAVGLGHNIVAVTKYCKFPPQAQDLTQLGGLFDTNLEAGILLQPDLVVGLPESRNVIDSFRALKVQTLRVSDRSVEEIYASISKICYLCDCPERATQIIAKLKNDSEIAVSLRRNQNFVSAAMIIASAISGGTEELYLSGRDGYYSSILGLLNAKNVFINNTSAIPSGSFETLAALSPDAIFVVEESQKRFDELKEKLSIYLPKSVFIRLSGEHVFVPGPRFPELMEDIARGLNLAVESKVPDA